MRYTQNIKLPIVEDNDLYSKEINNLAFEKIDEEIQGLADIVETLDSPENSIADVKKDINNINSDIVDINEQLETKASKDNSVKWINVAELINNDLSGNTEYTTIINEAIEDNTTLYFPSGVYKAKIEITKRNVRIYGEGEIVGGIYVNFPDHMYAPYTVIEGVTIKAGLDGDYGIKLRFGRYVEIRNCIIRDSEFGIKFESANYWQNNRRDNITNCRFYNNKIHIYMYKESGVTHEFENGDIHIMNNQFYTAYESSLYIYSCDGVIIEGNTFFSDDTSTNLSTSHVIFLHTTEWTIIQGNNIFGGGKCSIYAENYRNLNILGNNLSVCGKTNPYSAICVGATSNDYNPIILNIINNNIVRSTKHGIEILGENRNANIQGNSFFNIGEGSNYYGETDLSTIEHYAIYAPKLLEGMVFGNNCLKNKIKVNESFDHTENTIGFNNTKNSEIRSKKQGEVKKLIDADGIINVTNLEILHSNLTSYTTIKNLVGDNLVNGRQIKIYCWNAQTFIEANNNFYGLSSNLQSRAGMIITLNYYGGKWWVEHN